MAATRPQLIAAALAARKSAYAPYSQFRVGAAVETSDGRIVTGCNVENASYGLAICAERAAVCRAVAGGVQVIRRLAVVADYPTPCPPCGACRQFLHEFNPRMEIIMVNLKGARSTARLDRLLPRAFVLSRHRQRKI
ncbi:MAG: cytidine deaminase [Deltaproteobacteria bacterium]|nr:cytidine deaminase [Deltaproteobacteria bacterium]